MTNAINMSPYAGATGLALAMLIGAATPAVAEQRPSSVLAYAGVLSLDRGLDTRVYQGAFVDVYSDDLGIHADVVHVDREENAAFFSGGISYALSSHVRPKLMVGTSTDNRAILPDEFVSFSVELKPGENSGWVVTPGITYRHYRNGVDETSGSLAVAKYFDVPWDSRGYYVAQASVATTFGGNTRRANAAVTGGLQTVRRGGVSFGLTVEGGALVRDPIGGTTGSGSYFALRPNLSVPITRNLAWIARGEYSETSQFHATGATTGLKVGL